MGQEAATLVNRIVQASDHELKCDGSNLASGVYFYRLQAGGFVKTMKC
ncbi:MAG TPA: T9SS type A sorting domain-containing protein [Bacteroidota bacterium]|nr:T9SS type A sorting domain-containing protein [Bacteroidota bacterium]